MCQRDGSFDTFLSGAGSEDPLINFKFFLGMKKE
jgi:hypothetical protein